MGGREGGRGQETESDGVPWSKGISAASSKRWEDVGGSAAGRELRAVRLGERVDHLKTTDRIRSRERCRRYLPFWHMPLSPIWPLAPLWRPSARSPAPPGPRA